MNILIVVDMQKDFVDGALGTAEAVAILPNVVRRTAEAADRGERVIFTRDTHETNYLATQEGRKLPVPHCIRGTEGWEIVQPLRSFAEGCAVIDKPTFGSTVLGALLAELNGEEPVEKITLIGLCTDICVISNALLAKASLPEAEIVVDASCCAGVSPETHNNALAAMAVCQITVENN